jgi:hypothetical protein
MTMPGHRSYGAVALAGWLSLALIAGGCQAAPTSGLSRIERLIGEAACQADDDCRVIGVGAKACGGPDGYRAWSLRTTDARQLEEAVARDAARQREEQARSGMLSNCAIAPVPGVSCVRSAGSPGRCVLQGGGGRGAAAR